MYTLVPIYTSQKISLLLSRTLHVRQIPNLAPQGTISKTCVLLLYGLIKCDVYHNMFLLAKRNMGLVSFGKDTINISNKNSVINKYTIISNTIQCKIFERESIHEFCSFGATRESFLPRKFPTIRYLSTHCRQYSKFFNFILHRDLNINSNMLSAKT